MVDDVRASEALSGRSIGICVSVTMAAIAARAPKRRIRLMDFDVVRDLITEAAVNFPKATNYLVGMRTPG